MALESETPVDRQNRRQIQPVSRLSARRTAFALLVVSTAAAALAAFWRIVGSDGVSWLDAAMIACFAATLPWTAINFWNAAIGFVLLRFCRDPAGAVFPGLRRLDSAPGGVAPGSGRLAMLMTIRNEDPGPAFRRLLATSRGLDAAGLGKQADIYVLSDTGDPGIAAEEERLFADWRAVHPDPKRLIYRRRTDNAGHKTGNLWDFLERWGRRYEYMLVLDADSLMTGDAVVRMLRVMRANPGIGILQSLVVGLPSGSAFARLFQFGMRHGMLAYTTGSAWWQGDSGPYWGHNAAIRVAPFMRHCRLPELPGRPPLGGKILSHDQVEAVLMRRAGYEVRAIPEEGGSYEINPPTLPDFICRDLRWCQGNWQYVKLLTAPGLLPLGRVQLLLAILMYAMGPAWIGFMAFGVLHSVGGVTGLLSVDGALPWLAPGMDPAVGPEAGSRSDALWIGFLIGMLGLVFSPKLLGAAAALSDGTTARAWGGRAKLAGGALAELIASTMMAPIVSLAQARFVATLLLFGKCVRWDAQNRDDRTLSWREAARKFALPTLAGLVALSAFALFSPGALPFAAPILVGLTLAIPFAKLTASPALGRWLARRRLLATPEELAPDMEMRLAGYGPPEPPPARADAVPLGAAPLDR